MKGRERERAQMCWETEDMQRKKKNVKSGEGRGGNQSKERRQQSERAERKRDEGTSETDMREGEQVSGEELEEEM